MTSITNIITGETNEPRSLSYWFYKNLAWKLLSQTKVCTPHGYLVSRTLIDELPGLSREDIEQQAWLYLIQMWDFYADHYRHNRVARFVFYDYVRFNLIKYMATWIAHQIHLSVADTLIDNTPGITYIEDPETLDLSLGWVILKSEQGALSSLSTRQRYLIYLRYFKQLSILEIAELAQRNHKSIEKDFTAINKIIRSGENT